MFNNAQHDTYASDGVATRASLHHEVMSIMFIMDRRVQCSPENLLHVKLGVHDMTHQQPVQKPDQLMSQSRAIKLAFAVLDPISGFRTDKAI